MPVIRGVVQCCRERAMEASEDSYRLYNCARCARQVRICRQCDRGNRYCAAGCARECRGESLRRAGQRYQLSARGACTHAARQALWRRRHAQKVTHHGSPAMATMGIVASTPTTTQGEDHADTASGGRLRRAALRAQASFAMAHATLAVTRCSLCGTLLPHFARRGPLRTRR